MAGEGLFRVAETLYGISIRASKAATWHADVRFFDVKYPLPIDMVKGKQKVTVTAFAVDATSGKVRSTAPCGVRGRREPPPFPRPRRTGAAWSRSASAAPIPGWPSA